MSFLLFFRSQNVGINGHTVASILLAEGFYGQCAPQPEKAGV